MNGEAVSQMSLFLSPSLSLLSFSLLNILLENFRDGTRWRYSELNPCMITCKEDTRIQTQTPAPTIRAALVSSEAGLSVSVSLVLFVLYSPFNLSLPYPT